MNTLKLYNKLATLPYYGSKIFSTLLCFKAPYFRTISPHVTVLKPGYAEVVMKQRWGLQNHLQTVHAIAQCNLIELTMGMAAEASIPSHLRWIPKGMNVQYVSKGQGVLTGKISIDPVSFFDLDSYPGDVFLPVTVTNEKNEVVSSAEVQLYITEKPKK